MYKGYGSDGPVNDGSFNDNWIQTPLCNAALKGIFVINGIDKRFFVYAIFLYREKGFLVI